MSYSERISVVTRGEEYSENWYFVSNVLRLACTFFVFCYFTHNWIRFCPIFNSFFNAIEKTIDKSRSLPKWKSFDNNNNFIAIKQKTQHEVFINFGFRTISCAVCLRVRVCSLKFHFLFLFVRYSTHAQCSHCSRNLFKSNIQTKIRRLSIGLPLDCVQLGVKIWNGDDFDGDWFILCIFSSFHLCLVGSFFVM